MLLHYRIAAAILLLSCLFAAPVMAENEGQGDLDKATETRIGATTLTDLGEVIHLLENALKKGLDADNTAIANEMLVATRIQRGMSVTGTILGEGPPDPHWPQFRELALGDLNRALDLDPEHPKAWMVVAQLNLLPEGDHRRAVEALEHVVRLSDDQPRAKLQALALLALIHGAEGRPRKGIEIYTRILADIPDNTAALRGRADALLSIGEHGRAIADYKKALELLGPDADDAGLLNNYAWVLATSPDDELRDGDRSLEAATEACRLTEYKQPHILSTLAAAHAEKGDFDAAVEWSQKAVELADTGDVDDEQKKQLAEELKSYQEKKPLRERQETPEREPSADDGWIELVGPKGFDAWESVDGRLVVAGDAALAPDKPENLAAKPGTGVLVAETKNKAIEHLVTKKSFGDCELHLEFMMAKRSNSGVKFHEQYEIQLLDSHGKTELSGNDCGGVYPRWRFVDDVFTYVDDGVPPSVNACKPAGQWQTLDAVFRAPRFDAEGNKTENAKLVIVKLNGQVIHENVELKTPTGHIRADEKAYREAPLLLQLNHGPVAFRNVRIRPSQVDD